MPKSNNLLMSVTAVFLLIFSVLACSEAKDDSTPPASPPAADRTGDSINALPKTGPTPDIAGNYSITGTNEGGGGNYGGDLLITPRNDVYQFSWSSGAKSYDGVGVTSGNTAAVAFSEGTNGEGCGVVLYDIAANGNLIGRAGYWGVNEAETENATRVSGSDLAGTYNIDGSNPGGERYSGKLEIKKDGEGYAFNWDTGSQLAGFGIRMGEQAAVGFGGAKCGFVMYEIKSNGTLEGKWGGQGSKRFGTEIAKKK